MQSFILVGNFEKIHSYLLEFYKKENIDAADQLVIQEEGSIGIATIRSLQQRVYIKPFRGSHKALVIYRAESLTTESQNALLKLLEEPPAHLFIFLTTDNEQTFLPTILSRCKIIVLEKIQEVVSDLQKSELLQQLEIVEQGSVGEKLGLAEKIAGEKAQLSQWFEYTIRILREKVLQNPKDPTLLTTIMKIQEAYKDLQTTNVSPRMILEHAFLSF